MKVKMKNDLYNYSVTNTVCYSHNQNHNPPMLRSMQDLLPPGLYPPAF